MGGVIIKEKGRKFRKRGKKVKKESEGGGWGEGEWGVAGVVIGSSSQPWDHVVWPWLRLNWGERWEKRESEENGREGTIW